MNFPLFFLIVLSLLLLFAAFLIWKSNLSSTDKIVALIGFIVLFSIVSVANEFKRMQANNILKFSISRKISDVFYDNSREMIKNKFDLPKPQRNSTQTVIDQFSATSNFASQPTFLLIYGDNY